MDPNELILLLYKEALRRLNLGKNGILENDPRKKGENIGRAIAIISELNACLDSRDASEEISFLRGLYTAILLELPKASTDNDVKPVETTIRYIEELKSIWERSVMGKAPAPPAGYSGGGTARGYGAAAPAKTSFSV
jgi:flagellar protein FliS